MPEGRRWSPENPSPAMKSFAEFIRSKGYDVSDRDVAATFVFHREWQAQHAQELVAEREAAKEQREKDAEAKKAEREQKKAEAAQKKADKEAEKERKRQEREAAKAEKEASKGADGDDTPVENGEPAKTSRRLRVKGGEGEPVAAGAGQSESSF